MSEPQPLAIAGEGRSAYANTFVSSDPGSGSGGVSITFYQRH